MIDRSTFRRLHPNYQFPTSVVPTVGESIPAQGQNNRFNVNVQDPNYDLYGNPLPPVTAQNGNTALSLSNSLTNMILYRYRRSNCVR
jgi:hypothetical protein